MPSSSLYPSEPGNSYSMSTFALAYWASSSAVCARFRNLSGAIPKSTYQLNRCSTHSSCNSTSFFSPGWRYCGGLQKYSISICSNSRVRKVKFPGVISLRKALPTCATPNGSLRRITCCTFAKLAKMPCAVSRSEEHTSELQSRPHLVCRLLLEKKKTKLLSPTYINTKKTTKKTI